MQITMDKKYIYRNGESARILCVDSNKIEFPVVSIANDGTLCYHHADGTAVIESWSLIEEWTPQDKEPVWAWDKGYACARALRFFDAYNNCCFVSDGSRNGPCFIYYAKVEHLEQWMLDAQTKLQN